MHKAKVKVTHSYKTDVVSIVGQTGVLSLSGLHKSQQHRPYSNVPVKTLKKKKKKNILKDKPAAFYLYIDSCLSVWDLLEKNLSLPQSSTCVKYVSLMLSLKCVSLCDSDNVSVKFN